ncbi:unnamed protein product, partial [marine sediment metagenome]
MATTENVLSQEFHETAEGVTLLRRFSSTYDDYNNGSALFRTIPYSVLTHPFPYRIGDALNYDGLSFPVTTSTTSSMRITDIELIPIDNVNITIEVFYSNTYSNVVPKALPDTNASWSDSFSINSVVTEIDQWNAQSAGGYMDRYIERETRSGDLQTWTSAWAAAGKGGEEPETIASHEPEWAFTITTFSRKLWINRILTYLLSVNNDDWLADYFGKLADRSYPALVGGFPGLTDTDWAVNDTALYPSFSPTSYVLSDIGRWL